MQQLQDAGVEAGAVLHFDDLLKDPQLASRGHFEILDHVHLGEMAFEHSAIRCSDDPPRLHGPGPNLGEHTRSVLRDALGMDAAEIDSLVKRGVLV